MLKKLTIILVFIFSTITQSYSQMNDFDALFNKMFFNIGTINPDITVVDFLYKYYPFFLLHKQEKHQWVMYPDQDSLPKMMKTIHSLVFTHHPFFDCKFREGRLDIVSEESREGPRSIREMRLWFMFNTKKDAVEAFNQLKIIFKDVCESKNILNDNNNGRLVANYADKEFPFRGVRFILTNDELYDKNYKILFEMK